MIDHSVLESFAGKNVLVTGGTGTIGRQVVARLCEAGADVKSVSLDRLEVDPAVTHVHGDLMDFGLCQEIVSDMDFVFHVAGIKGSVEVTKSQPATFFVPLLMMNTNILEACRREKVGKVVYTSSVGAYAAGEVLREADDDLERRPMDMFPGWAKRMAELQVEAYRIQYGLENFSIVRPSNVYGPGDNFDPDNAMVVPSLMGRIGKGEDPVTIWGDGSAIRDFVYSGDVAEGIILAMYYGTGGGFVNLGGGKGHSIRELVETLSRVVPFNYVFDPDKPSGFPKRVMDISLAREKIHYHPHTNLYDGLKQTWDWFAEHSDEHLNRFSHFA